MTDLNKIIDELSKLTVVEAADLSKQLEEKWGVSAAVAAAPAAAPDTIKGPGASKQEKGTIVFAQSTLQCPHGVNTVYCGAYDSVAWGIGEDLFTWRWKDGGGINYEAGQLAESYTL